MRIALFCATRRGVLFLKKLRELAPRAELVVFSFKEQANEPRFLEEIANVTAEFGGTFCEVRRGEASEVAKALAEGFDLLFAVSWRYLIPREVYARARIGSFALHDSLLPKNRGFSPTVWAIINGESETGATLFEMTERADEGAILDQERVEMFSSDTIAEVLERVTAAYLNLLERNITSIMAGKWSSQEQDHSLATYCRKRRLEDNLIDWKKSAREVANLVRALTRPYPGAFTIINGKKLTVWRVSIVDRLTADQESACVVNTSDGAVRLEEVQWEGDTARPAVEVIEQLRMILG